MINIKNKCLGVAIILSSILVVSIITLTLLSFSVINRQEVSDVSVRKEEGYPELLSSFVTSFETSGKNRSHNVELASSMLNNVTVSAGTTITFNNVVGERTYERGYLDAIVIMKGVYVKGVGGGVCQVSSTMYNAWLLAGLDVVESKAHTLPSTYVELSRDATVSSEIDLVLANATDSDVIIKVCTEGNLLNISVYGKKRGNEYKLTTEILEEVPSYIVPDITIEVENLNDVGEEIYCGKSGYKSRLLIEVINNGKLVAKRELRRDNYAPTPTQKVIRVLKPREI